MIGLYPLFLVIMSALASVALAWWWRLGRDTTLIWAWGWAAFATTLAIVVEFVIAVSQGSGRQAWHEPLRYLSATAALTPGIAVLGCKRPQDVGWNFVVASLWAIVSLPAIYALFLPTSNRVEVFPALQVLLMVAVMAQTANYLPTRFAWAACCVTAGQVAWLAPYFAGGGWLQIENSSAFVSLTSDWRFPIVRAGGMLALVTGMLWSGWMGRLAHPPNVHVRDRLWLDFRNYFGSLWALRVQQRMVESARRFDWKLKLHWDGFVVEPTPQGLSESEASAAESDRKDHSEIERALRSLLRRFVGHDWIGQRLPNK